MNPTPDRTLDDPQQVIADLKRQLAESNAERDKAQQQLIERTAERDDGEAQQAAMAEVLGVINASPGDLAPVFQAMVEKALRLCEATYGTLRTFDGESFHLAAAAHGEALGPLPTASQGPNSLYRRFIDGEQIVHLADVLNSPEYQSNLTVRQGLGAARLRSWLGVALRNEERLLGVIAAGRQEVRPFSDKQIALLQNFAAQAVIAMENARLIAETREALEQQTATAEVLQVINSSPGDLAPVFEAILDKARAVCGFAHGSLNVYDGEYFRTVAMHGYPAAFAEVLRQPRRTGPQARFLEGDRIVHITDVSTELPVSDDPVYCAAIEAGVRTVLFVPLHHEQRLLGYITANRREVRPFSEKEIALLENFAAQAVIAMENARLITETREALEQQTATAEVLGVINASPGDLGPVFDAVLEKAMRLCGAAIGMLATYDGEHFQNVAHRGIPAAFANALAPFQPAPTTMHARILGGARIVHVADLMDEEAYRSGEPLRRALVDLGGARTGLIVPLRKDERVLGTFTIYRQEVRAFSEKQIALIENFAAQAVIAMENARLLGELRQRTEEVGELNRDLEARVAEQVDELGRVGRLKRFLAPQLAELIVSQGDEKILESHRREIVVVFCDLRGYTSFTETAEPEEVLEFLRQYHGALGPLVSQFEGTLDQFSGDGIMVFFNDPVPCPDPAVRAVNMAVAMRDSSSELIAAWSRHGCELGFGVGIAQGFATLGQIGFSERSGYTAIGTVCNLAARLCAEAKDGQILVSSRIAEAVEAVARLEDLGNLDLKGLRRPVAAFNIAQSTSPAEARPNLTVVARDTGA